MHWVHREKSDEMAAPSQTSEPIASDRALSAILALLVADREDRLAGEGGEGRRTELVLTAAGLSAPEIASLVSKNVEAVRKTIQRGKAKP